MALARAGEREEPGWSWHCADAANAAVIEATGRDMLAELGGSPRGWREAADFYRRLGVRTLAGAVTAVLGAPLASPRLARRGDIALVLTDTRGRLVTRPPDGCPTASLRGGLGIVRGELIECMGANVPLGEAERAWRALTQRWNGRPVPRTGPRAAPPPLAGEEERSA